MINNAKSTYRLVETSWAGKRQHERAKRNPENQMVDATSKTNNQGRPLGIVSGADGEQKMS